ncbi:MAG TPA: branched-chain-amino-acid transaminase [Acidimicrobiaceae bacterium]|nr:branched-chain-amino-acid transaminase [Acidimicrobiaceae bacterium]HCB37194.1 branched-chain-amino-acid transaminase [Acidimicrobiaceae bacterium]
MATARCDARGYDYAGAVEPFGDLTLSPAAHVLHYASAVFEGLKAHRQADGGVAVFRLDDHVERMRTSAAKLRLPVPDAEMLRAMIVDAVTANAAEVPDPPGSLYIRPTLIGTEPNIGAAATPSSEALLYIVNCPVGDYFTGGVRPLTLLVESCIPRTTPQFGMVKSGANYAMALTPTLDAMAVDESIDQMLFATGGDVTETGASNFFLADGDRLVTRQLDGSFLHGVTRSSVITLAGDLGYEVEERPIEVDELVATAGEGEAFLSGTAAVIAPVGTMVIGGERHTVGDGQPGKTTLRLRETLVDIAVGRSDDPHGWRTRIDS